MDPRNSVIEKRLGNIKRIISVASGKGGVGKSLVASTLALALSEKGFKVGLLDLDFYGPSSHIILGLERYDFPQENKGIIPINVNGVNFMSIVFFTEDKPAPFRGVDITNIIIELLSITQWGVLDFLIIDMPPGLGEETLDVIRLVKKNEFLIVTTSSKVSMAAVNKLLFILKELSLPLIGVIENMKIENSNYIKNDVSKMKIRYLGFISFDKNLEQSIGNKTNLFKTNFMKDLKKILNKIV
ncbi:MAG: Mrp/NBP35 family ATP-binding protein [Candidatus Thermoplasmatota archaeon]|jgi:ATP-binding protein involved in chromosome partitioning|nr:Mrp/NBP35 family ATP-binding protein [Candidatus Thermoplasmatota archaeon]